MQKLTEFLMNDEKFVVTALFLKAIKTLEVNLAEMYLLLFIDNQSDPSFDPDKMSKVLGLTKNEVLASFNSLVSKGIIEINSSVDSAGKVSEVIHLSGLKKIMEDLVLTTKANNEKKDIYHHFENEFGRTISPMEYEIIESWLNNGTTEELILGALKESVYNSVKSFRYIDKIIYSWSEKGFKTMQDVNSHLKNRSSKQAPELFDYNWLEDEE